MELEEYKVPVFLVYLRIKKLNNTNNFTEEQFHKYIYYKYFEYCKSKGMNDCEFVLIWTQNLFIDGLNSYLFQTRRWDEFYTSIVSKNYAEFYKGFNLYLDEFMKYYNEFVVKCENEFNEKNKDSFFGFPLDKGHLPSKIHFLWLEINCNIGKPQKRLSYNEFITSLFMSFITYSRKRYDMTPLLYKDISIDIFLNIINKYIENEENNNLLLQSVEKHNLSTFNDKFIVYISRYFLT